MRAEDDSFSKTWPDKEINVWLVRNESLTRPFFEICRNGFQVFFGWIDARLRGS